MISLDAAGLWAAFCGESTAELVVLGLGLFVTLVEMAFGMLTSGVMCYHDLRLTRRLCGGRLMRSQRLSGFFTTMQGWMARVKMEVESCM